MRNAGPNRTQSRRTLTNAQRRRLEDELAEIMLFFDRASILRETTQLLTDRYGFHAAWLAEGGSAGATVCYTSGTTRQLEGLLLRPGRGLGGKVFAEGRLAMVDDYLSSSEITHHYDRPTAHEGIRSMIAAPIPGGEGPPSILLGGLRDTSTFGDRAAAVVEEVTRITAHSLRAAAHVREVADAAVRRERCRLDGELGEAVSSSLSALQLGIRRAMAQRDAGPELRARLGDLDRRVDAAAVRLREAVRKLDAPQGTASLAPRERAVLRAIARGESNPEIAGELNLSVNTVKTYVRAIVEKLHVRNRVQAVAVARERGLL